REDDAADLAFLQRRDRERDREVCLAGAGRADREGHRATANLVYVALLRDRLRGDLVAAVTPDDVLEDRADVLSLVERVEDRVDCARADLLPGLDEVDELVHHRARLGDLRVVALDRELI